jgi:hypothetical protein
MVKILQFSKINADFQEKNIEDVFSKTSLEALSTTHRYNKCPVKKIDAESFVLGFMDMLSEGKNNLRTLCLTIGVYIGDSIAKSSLEDRFNKRTLSFVSALLQQLLNIRLSNFQDKQATNVATEGLVSKFNNVYLADSTCQSLPDSLHETFPSSHNTAGKLTATLRIQVIYNYSKRLFSYFDLGNYRQNDQSSSDNIFDVLKKGDLIIRDLGYSVLSVFAQMNTAEIFYISRFMPHIHVFDAESGEKIELLSFLKGKTEIDINVQVGAKERLKTRLVARKLPKPAADARIDKAKKDRHNKANHSAEYYEFLKWEIFITNVCSECLSAEQVNLLYQLRWFIEIIFKSWKSHFNFKKVLDCQGMSFYRTLITIVLMLVKITYSFMHLYAYIDQEVQRKYNKTISPIKFMDVVNSIWSKIIVIKSFKELQLLIPQFAAHATYEKRRTIVNMKNKFK